MECTLYLTDSCNLVCNYCYEGDTKNKSFLSSEKLREAITYMLAVNQEENIHLTFLGGEPLLNKERLYEAVSVIEELCPEYREVFRFAITTNAVFLEEKEIELFRRYGFEVSVSLDGDEETNNLNRKSKNGQETYGDIIKKLDLMREQKFDFNIRMTVTPNNVHKFYSNIEFFYNRGIEKINCALDHFGDWRESDLKELERQFRHIDQFYFDKIQDPDCELRINFYDYKFTTFLVKQQVVFCSGGSEGHLTINSKGELYPCGFVTNDPTWNLGDVKTGLERGRFIQTARACVKKGAPCGECDIAFTCSGRKCGFQNYVSTGFLNITDEIVCKLERILYRHNDRMIRALYALRHPRIMEIMELIEAYKLEPSVYMQRLVTRTEKRIEEEVECTL